MARCFRGYGIVLMAAAVLVSMVPAQAQRVLTVTQSLSAAREAARIYVQSVDLGWGNVLPAPFPLPEPALMGPLLFDPDRLEAVVSSGRPWSGGALDFRLSESTVSHFGAVPPALWGREYEEGWREWAGALLRHAAPRGLRLMMLGTKTALEGIPQNRARVMTLGSEDSLAYSWDLPGVPLSAVVFDNDTRAVVLCRDHENHALLVQIPLEEPERPIDSILLYGQGYAVDAAPAGLALSSDGRFLLVLLSGFSFGRPGGEAASWLHLFDTEALEPAGAPVELPGAARIEDAPLQPAGEGLCWVATGVPGSDFAYATRVSLEAAREGREAKEQQHALAGLIAPLRLAPAPGSGDVAAGLGRRLEIWPGGDRSGPAMDFRGPVRVVRWTEEGLLLGEGGRLHAIDPGTAQPGTTVQLQSGWVCDVALIPATRLPEGDWDGDGMGEDEERRLGTDPWNPDTDGDGIPDGLDPEPRTLSPLLEATPSITFRADAAGREIRTLLIKAHGYENASWRITYDPEEMPWLMLYPRSGRGRWGVPMGIDPARLPPGQPAHGVLRVEMDGLRPGYPAAGSPAEVRIRIDPGRGDLRRILWVWSDTQDAPLRDPSDPRRLRALADLLAGPPHYFAHREATGLFEESLYPYTVVVVDALAAARAAITRQAVLDYVADGGALLFLGAHLEGEAGRALGYWLSPMRVRIDTGVRVTGRYAVAGDEQVSRYWRDFLIEDGCAIGAEEGYALEPGGVEGTGAVFLARSHGLGRIALIAAPTPLESAALARQDERRFATALFRWLARAGQEYQDRDGDGLPDQVEISNNIFVIGTDPIDPDTDGDGIPDGMEDFNRNGIVDDGETDPRNPDSDGDGILDGADVSPSPVFGAPFLTSVQPEVPAEGGIVVVSGGNFTPDCMFWFEERPAPWTRIQHHTLAFVQTPDFKGNDRGAVRVRVSAGGGALEGMLPRPYTYGPRTVLRFSLTAEEVMRHNEDTYTGIVSLRWSSEANTAIGAINLVLQATPSEGFRWEDPIPGEILVQAQRRLRASPLEQGLLQITVDTGGLVTGTESVLARLPWRWDGAAPEEGHIALRPLFFVVQNTLGGRLATPCDALTIDFPGQE